jgi:hypothetical protein
VTQLRQRLGFDLADALAGDVELAAGLFERVVGSPIFSLIRRMRSSRAGSVARTRAAASPRSDWAAASKARTAPSSSIRIHEGRTAVLAERHVETHSN